MLPPAPVSRRESAMRRPEELNSRARVPVVLTRRRTIWLVISDIRYWPDEISEDGDSLSATANALAIAGVGDDVLLVSDPYHALRAKEIAREVGLSPRFSPTDLDSTLPQLVRETVAVSLGRIVGFRRVSNLSQ